MKRFILRLIFYFLFPLAFIAAIVLYYYDKADAAYTKAK